LLAGLLAQGKLLLGTLSAHRAESRGAKDVTTHEAWPWSSYTATAGRQRAPDWLAVPEVLSLFGRSARVAQAAYRTFVREGIGQPSPWAEVRGQIFLGDAPFLARVERLVRGQWHSLKHKISQKSINLNFLFL